VYAFAPGRRKLETPVKIPDGREFTRLPDEVDLFFRVALQRATGRHWWPRDSEEGRAVRRVMALSRIS